MRRKLIPIPEHKIVENLEILNNLKISKNKKYDNPNKELKLKFKELGELYYYHLTLESWEDDGIFVDDRKYLMNDIKRLISECESFNFNKRYKL